MSVPFFTKKKDAEDFWKQVAKTYSMPAKDSKVVKVYIPASRGFLQAPKSGNYYTCAKYARILKFKKAR